MGVATVTSPAPLRNAASPVSDGAPAIPREPPSTNTRPKLPLWLSARRGASCGNGWAEASIIPFTASSTLWFGATCRRTARRDQACEVASLETGVDVYHGDVGRTTIEHCQ